MAVLLQKRLNVRDLFSGGLAGERQRLGDDGTGRRLRARLAPQRVDRVLRKGFEFDALERESGFQTRDLSGCVQPGIEADRLAFGERGR